MGFHDEMLKDLGIDKDSDANVLTQQPPKESSVPKVNDFKPNSTHQMDLLYLTHDQVDKTKYRYTLTVMDTATKFGDAEPLAERSATAVLKALEIIYKRGILKKPSVRITTDQGSEFKGAFDKWVKDQGLIHKVARTGNSRQVSLAEMLNYFIGKYVGLHQHKKEDATGVHNREWVSILPTLIRRWNIRSRRKLGLNDEKENKKTEDKKVEKEMDEKMEKTGTLRCTGKECQLLEVGTKVRAIRIKPKDDVTGKRLHGGFRAGDKRWEQTVRTITKVILKAGQPPLYKLSGIDDATFSRNRIQVVGQKNEELNANREKWIIEKIIKRTTIKGKIHYRIKWKGWAAKHNSYQPRDELVEDVPGMIEQYEDKHPLTKAQQAKVDREAKSSLAKNVNNVIKPKKKAKPRAKPRAPVRRSARIASTKYVKRKIGN